MFDTNLSYIGENVTTKNMSNNEAVIRIGWGLGGEFTGEIGKTTE